MRSSVPELVFLAGFALVGGLVFFEANLVVVEDEVVTCEQLPLSLGGVCRGTCPVIAVEGEIAASSRGTHRGLCRWEWSFVGEPGPKGPFSFVVFRGG